MKFETGFHAVECTLDGSLGGEPSKMREFVPGLQWWTIDGVEVSKEEWDRSVTEFMARPQIANIYPDPK